MKYLVLCSGLYVELANALADGGKNTVWYYTGTQSAFPKFAEYAPGYNFEHLTKVRTLWDYVDKADAIISFDCGSNDAIEYIRKKYPEKSVFGAGKGERLETDRLGFKKMLETLDLPFIPYVEIKGFTNLRKYLEANPKKVIKADANFRGDFETLAAPDYQTIKQVLDDRAPAFGIYSEEISFIVEDMVDCVVEAGFDGFFSGGEFTAFSVGIESAKNLYLAKVGNDVPDILNNTLDAFRPVFEKIGYAGAISTEERIISKSKSFFIDACCRCPLPLGVLYSRFVDNWSEVVWKIGRNEPYEIQCPVKYVGAFALGSDNSKEHFSLVQIKEGHRDDFRFQMATQNKKGEYYSVKGCEAVITVVAGGDSPQEVVDTLKKNAENVSAHGLDTDAIKGIDSIFDEIKKAESVGVKF